MILDLLFPNRHGRNGRRGGGPSYTSKVDTTIYPEIVLIVDEFGVMKVNTNTAHDIQFFHESPDYLYTGVFELNDAFFHRFTFVGKPI
jgi:hypothetical protein